MAAQALPRLTLVHGLVNGVVGPAIGVAPRRAAEAVSGGEQHLRILRIHGQVGDADASPEVEHVLPGGAAVGGAIDAPLHVVGIGIAHGRHENGIGVLGVNRDR